MLFDLEHIYRDLEIKTLTAKLGYYYYYDQVLKKCKFLFLVKQRKKTLFYFIGAQVVQNGPYTVVNG
jgi:hypothetical protein